MGPQAPRHPGFAGQPRVIFKKGLKVTPWLHWEEGAHGVNGWVQMAFTEDSLV